MGHYELTQLSTVFGNETDEAAYKIKNLSDYTSWLAGPQGKPLSEIEQVLREKSAEINVNVTDVTNGKRIYNYELGQYVYAITKHASSGVVAQTPGYSFSYRSYSGPWVRSCLLSGKVHRASRDKE